ncbi:MAG: A/G-specific adenine glycosylase [Proteobacteria bacterium]|nr:A/G-specific adenine glycosylase [Pseudomonadota bacterium]
MTDQRLQQQTFSSDVLAWYDENARSLPWRSPPGEKPDPYHVWLSEIMLQQTTVVTVGPYFEKFLKSWPSVKDMAVAELDEILTAWAGLGYYARARNLHKCAQAVTNQHNGIFPNTLKGLLDLPGIGPYTAAAIAAIAYAQSETVVDGNIERIISRVCRIRVPLPAAKKPITEEAALRTPAARAGDYAQALMDIGATICTPRNPGCSRCPVSRYCTAFDHSDMETYPVKAPKKKKPTRRAVIFWLQDGEGAVLLHRRAEKGLLGGMMEFPSTDWQEKPVSPKDAVAALISNSGFRVYESWETRETVRHTFTHFHLELLPVRLTVLDRLDLNIADTFWSKPENFDQYALPTLMRKVAKSVQEGQGSLL